MYSCLSYSLLAVSLLLAILISPILFILTLPNSHTYRSSPHPPSPHSPPAGINLTEQQIHSWKEDGLLILKKAMPDNLLEKINIGAADLEANDTVQCKIAYYNGPPTFHKFSHFCHWPDKVHDYFRDALYNSPMAHVASQLMGGSPVRVFDTFTMGSNADVTLTKRWHSDYPLFTGVNTCDNGLVMWMPMRQTSYHDANGMIFARGSHKAHLEAIQDGTWSKYSKSISGLLKLLGFYKDLGDRHTVVAPTLEVGDVVIFSKCTIHSSSGVNSMNIPRHALQMRFFTDPQTVERGIRTPYPEMGDKFTTRSEFLSGSKYPRMWPETLQEEDAVRSMGHMFLTKMEWILHLVKYPDHLLVTSFTAWAEYFGVFHPDHAIYGYLVNIAEMLGIL